MSSLSNNACLSSQVFLHIKAVTWLKDSHSLFDYEFNKNINQNSFDISLSKKYVYMFRNNQSSQILIKQADVFEVQTMQGYQFLGGFSLNYLNKRAKVMFYQASQFLKLKKQSQDQLVTQGSAVSAQIKEEDIYLIVRSMKNQKNQNKGYKLEVGQTVKLGRVQYRISSIKKHEAGLEQQLPQANPFFDNYRTAECQKIQFNPQEEQVLCKYCLTNDQSDPKNFLMSPCKCSGSSGMVHFKCLEQWIKSKVKKEVIGGTTQYNFQKFFCQLCKLQFPRFIKREKQVFELMPITKPQKTSFIILEGITQKANNLMVIHNVPNQGIRMGRSHECEIRITDISVSRNHAKIEKIGDEFVLFDSKSKFGTLVKQPEMQIEVDKIKKGIQIGRTVITFELNKK